MPPSPTKTMPLGTAYWSGATNATANGVNTLVGNAAAAPSQTCYWGWGQSPYAGYLLAMEGYVWSASSATHLIGFSIAGVGEKLTATVTTSGGYFRATGTRATTNFSLNQNIYAILKSSVANLNVYMWVSFVARVDNL